MPTSVQNPAMPPKSSALTWYSPSRDSYRLGPRLRDDQPADVPDDHEQQAEVEQRRADPQQPRLVQLRRARRPAELVVAVAPDRAADQDRDHDVREHAPQQRRSSLVHPARAAQRQQPRVVRRPARPARAVGRPPPSHGQRLCRPATRPGSVAHTACRTSAYGRPRRPRAQGAAARGSAGSPEAAAARRPGRRPRRTRGPVGRKSVSSPRVSTSQPLAR